MTILVDGLAIYGGGWLALQASNHFHATAGIRYKNSEQLLERGHAWHIVTVIGLIGCIATVATTLLLGTGPSVLWPLAVFIPLVIVSANSGNQADKQARREWTRAGSS